MRIRRIMFRGIRGLDGLQGNWPRNKDTDLIVAYGGRAKGKTTFLDTLAAAKEAIASYGPPDARWNAVLAPGADAGKVQMDWEASPDESARFGLSEPILSGEAILGRRLGLPAPQSKPLAALLSDPGSPERGSVHYLHDSRALGGPVSYGAADAAKTLRLATRNNKFAALYDVLDQSDRGAARALAAQRFGELCPTLELAGLKRIGMTVKPLVKDRTHGLERTYSDLSSSEQQALLVALYVSQSPIVDSVVLIDAPESGFGDDGAVELVQALLRWTTRTQLVVATSSRAVRAMPEVGHVVELPS